jgi:hypothetical protein
MNMDIIYIIGVFAALIALFWQVVVDRHNLYADYSKRYQDFVMSLPDEIFKSDFDITIDKEYLSRICVYFDLCSDEWKLNRKCLMIDRKVWKDWVEGMQAAFEKPLYRDAWQMIMEEKPNYYDKKFVEFVNEITKK